MGVAERERAFGSGTGEPSQAAGKVVVFRVADQAYAISLDAVVEILPMATLTRPPGLPSIFSGFLNLGGTAVLVVRLAQLFGLPVGTPGLYAPLLIMRCTAGRLALLVDSVQGIASVDATATLPLEGNLCFNDCAEGVIMVAETRAVLLSHERLLREEEHRRIRELAAIEQSRLASFQGDPS